MTIEFYNLPMHLYKADNAQQVQNLFVMQERAGMELAQANTQETNRGEKADQVQDTDDADGSTIQDDGGAGGGRAGGDRGRREDERAPEAPAPPDPEGRGSIFDFRA
jgi:hypothetical protein